MPAVQSARGPSNRVWDGRGFVITGLLPPNSDVIQLTIYATKPLGTPGSGFILYVDLDDNFATLVAPITGPLPTPVSAFVQRINNGRPILALNNQGQVDVAGIAAAFPNGTPTKMVALSVLPGP